MYLNNIDQHSQQVDEFYKQYKEEQMTEKDYRLLKGVFSCEELKNDELQSIRNEMDRWTESDISSSHFIQTVPYSNTSMEKSSSTYKGKG